MRPTTAILRRPAFEAVAVLAILVATALILNSSMIGYYGGDDREYFLAARDWLVNFPPLGTTHWALRYPIVLPLALFEKMVGFNERAMNLVCLVYGTGVIALTYAIARAAFGPLAAILGAAVLVTHPVFVVGVVCLFSDVPELFYAAGALSLYLLNFHLRARPDIGISIAIGLMLSLAFMVRETSVVLVGFLFIAVLAHRAYRHVVAMGLLGFAPPNLAAMAYQWALSGNPLYRFALSAHHDAIDRSRLIDKAAKTGDFIDWNGSFAVNALLDPFLLLLANHKIGLIFWLMIAALLALYLGAVKIGPQHRRIVLALVLALVAWTLFVTLAGNILWLVARYLLVPIWIAVIVVAAVAARAIESGGRTAPVAVVALLGLAASNLLLLALEHKAPMVTERRLAEYIQQNAAGHRVYSDPVTTNNTNLVLLFDDSPIRVRARPHGGDFAAGDVPRGGDLVALSYKFLRQCREKTPGASEAACLRDMLGVESDPARWQHVDEWSFDVPRTLELLDRFGMMRYVPYGVARRLMRPDDHMAILRVTP